MAEKDTYGGTSEHLDREGVGSAISRGRIVDARDALSDGVVWHYFNPRLPELAGDYIGLAGVTAFFEKVARRSGGTFSVEPISAQPAGDELVVTHARLRLTIDARDIRTDAVVVWRVHDQHVVEVWDIPAVHAAPGGA